jgi:hypothetical protein
MSDKPIPKDRGIPITCWRCWWREGSHCYNKQFGEMRPDPVRTFLQLGHDITDEFFLNCQQQDGFRGKRAFLEQFFSKEVLVIASEHTVKDEETQ